MYYLTFTPIADSKTAALNIIICIFLWTIVYYFSIIRTNNFKSFIIYIKNTLHIRNIVSFLNKIRFSFFNHIAKQEVRQLNLITCRSSVLSKNKLKYDNKHSGKVTGKIILALGIFLLVNIFFISSAFAARRVTGVTFGGQTGTATSGTGTSVTYTLTLSEAGSSAPVADAISLTWPGGTPTGVTYAFTSSTEGSVTNTSFFPSGNPGPGTLLLTVTTTGATPAGTYNFTIQITDNNAGGGPWPSSGLSLVVGSPPVGISYTGSPFTYYRGTAISSLTPSVTGSPLSYAVSPALPAGLSLNTSTGVISGTPTTAVAAANYTVTATYSGGVTATATINITVLNPTISYTGSPFTYYNGTTISSLTPTVTGSPTSYSISPALPSGLSLNTSTGVISGTPTTTASAANYTITANYLGGVTATTTINITVLVSISISYTGSPFIYYTGTTITSLTPTVSGSPTSYSISPALPTGLSFNTSTGAISGTPTVTSSATGHTITANYLGGATTTATINITVLAQSISYTGSPFTYYKGTTITSLTPTVTNSPSSYAISPALPAGLSFNTSTGVISGAPTATSASTNYTITANYLSGVTATATINITVLNPTLSYTGSPFTYYNGITISSLTPTVTGTPTSYGISPVLPAGLSFNTSTGVISGTPSATAAAANYTITANYLGGVTATATINVTVLNPTLNYTGSPFTYYAGATISSLTPTVTGSPTSYGIVPALPAGLTLNTSTGVISGTPTVVSVATNYTITANYLGGGTATKTINITVLAQTISYTGSPFTYLTFVPITTLTPTVTNSPSSYSISPALPTGLSFNTSTGVISGTPTVITPTATYTITANYLAGYSVSTAISITVNLGPPIISYTPSTNIYTTGIAITALTPTNTGGAAASYSISPSLPAGLSINTSTGVISGTPTATITATVFTITATNTGGSGTTTVNLTVNPPPPVISYTPSTNIYTTGIAITALTPTNTGGAVASYSISPSLPAGLSINTSTGVISGTPTATIVATVFTITATNAGGSGTATVNLTVNPPAPIVSYTPSTNVYLVGVTITSLTPTNTGGAATIYTIGPALPAGLSFNSSTGVISGTPTAISAVTTYTISADNAGGVSTTTVTLSCVNPPLPVISYTPSTNVYITGIAITALTPTSTGGSVASYAVSPSLPAGLSINTTTGVISGTPTTVTSVATYTITAANAAGSATATVTITVNPGLPVISYSPSTNVYTKGTAITALAPTNTGGAAASYSISPGLPAGLSFNTSTGVISGTPTATSSVTTYTITATNVTGSATTTVTITVNNLPPVISYSPGTVTYVVGTTITPTTPVSTGGAPSSYSISGTLPTGLSFNTSTGVITGTPTTTFATATFTITATNSAGTSNTSLIITVSPSAPIISYTPSTNAYPVGAAITTLSPTNTGGAVTGYSYSATGTNLTGATLSGPSLMTIDASGNIYVCNYYNGTISRYNSSGTYLGTFGTGKIITNPEGIVFDSAGNAYVEDTGAGAVYKYNSAGVYQSTIISGLGHPLGIAINASNNIFIATYNTSTLVSSVTEYDTSGALLLTLPNANMNEADGVAVDPSGNIYVLNLALNLGAGSLNLGNVTKYSPSGTYLGVFSSGYNTPFVISCDASGNVYVADSHNNSVKVYDSNGVLLNTLGPNASTFGDVEGFVADASGNLFVANFTNNTVQKFTATGGYHISGALPPGLSFNTTTGQITGTPTSVFPATTYTITAYNITGSGSTNITLSCYNSFDWIGTTSTDWNTGSNWLSGVVPATTDQANIGVNRTFTNFPNVLTASGTVNVGSIQFGSLGGQAAGVVVNTGATLNVSGAITYQADASSTLGYICTLSGAGTINANSISVKANTTLASGYTETLTSSVTNLNVTTNVSLTSSNSGAILFNSTFRLTGGTASVSGIIQTTNTSTSTSSFLVVPTTTATLQLAGSTPLSGLSATGTNVVTFNNAGTTIQYSGAAQTVYTASSITGLSSGVSYQNISFSGTGVKTVSSGNLNIAGNFTNTLANDGSNYIDFSSPTVNFNGTTQSLAGGSGSGITFYTVNFSGAGTKTMASGLFNIASTGVLTMVGNSASTILATGGFLTLNSSATSSASIAAIPTGPSITGNVTVQRYVSGGSGYRNYRLGSSPVYAATVGSNNVYSVNYLQNSIYLTGTAGGGFDKTGNPTLYLYREDQTPSNASFISGNFWGISSINNSPAYNYGVTGTGGSGTFNIPVGNGFLFFFRGNRASASLATETSPSYNVPVAVTTSTSGPLNQGQVVVRDWYTPGSSNLGYTGTGTGTNYTVRGFNLVGNPYASSIDWEQFNSVSPTTGIYGSNVSTTVYELNPLTSNYDTYQQGGIYTNHGRRTIVSGQGFFVLVTGTTSPRLIFNESAKSVTQSTGLNLFLSTSDDIANINGAGVNPHLRLQMAKDSINTDDTYIGFNAGASTKYVVNEDAEYKMGNGKVHLASYSSDNIPLAIAKMPFPGLKQATIPLYVNANSAGAYSLNMTEMVAIPEVYQVWLIDKYKKDSLDMRHNKTYTFDISADTNSFGSHRFQLVIRQDVGLAVHLINFNATKTSNGVQTTWVTENEQNLTTFTVERSTDGGVTFNVVGGFASSLQGSYSFLDRAPIHTVDMYRLKMEDLNGNITYSKVVTIYYDSASDLASNNISIYPNPVKTTLNLTVRPAITIHQASNQVVISGQNTGASDSPTYTIKITNAAGAVMMITTATGNQWQTDVSRLNPGTYVLQVINKTNNVLIGTATFVKI